MSMDITAGMISKTKNAHQLKDIYNKMVQLVDEAEAYNDGYWNDESKCYVDNDIIYTPQIYGENCTRKLKIDGYHVLEFGLRNSFVSDIIRLVYDSRFSYDLTIFEDVYFIEWNDCGDGSIDGYLVYTIPNKDNEIFKRNAICTELHGGSRIYPAFLNYSHETGIPEDTLQEIVVKTIDIFD